MKKIYFLIILVGFLSSCDSVKDLQPMPSDANEIIPRVVVNAVKADYPDAAEMKFLVVEKSKIWESEFKVKANKMSAIINNLGQITEAYKTTTEVEIPESAKSFIAKNYPEATVKSVNQQVLKDGKVLGYKIVITTKDGKEVTMLFDATGTLTLLVANDRNTPVKPQDPPKTILIEQKDLPEAIRTALSQAHGDYRFVKAAMTKEGEVKTYNVVVAKDLTIYEYVFDEKGNILKSGSVGVNSPKIEDKTLEEKDLPAAIKTILDKDYKGWVWQKGIISLRDGQIQGYHILVKVDKKTYSLQFDANGKLQSKQEVGDNSGNTTTIKLIEEKDLPKVVVDYLKSKHKDYKYIQISLVTDKEVKTYWVTVAEGTTAFDYTFNEKGALLKSSSFPLTKPIIEDKELAATEIPAGIKAFLDKKYAGWVFQKGKTTTINGKLELYLIVVKVGNDLYYVTFDEKEIFVSVRKG